MMVFAGERELRASFAGVARAGGAFRAGVDRGALSSCDCSRALVGARASEGAPARDAPCGGGHHRVRCGVARSSRRGEPSATNALNALVRRARAALSRPVDAGAAVWVGVALGWLALALWAAFALWRGATVFSPNHDGVAYHLPKAAMIALAHGYETFDGPDVRVSYWRCNYELLLADAMLLDGSDVHTAWVSTASLGAFLLAVGAVAERWWGRGPHVVLAMLLAAGMTVVPSHERRSQERPHDRRALRSRNRERGEVGEGGRDRMGVHHRRQCRDHDRH